MFVVIYLYFFNYHNETSETSIMYMNTSKIKDALKHFVYHLILNKKKVFLKNRGKMTDFMGSIFTESK